jgi:hypothetical protein
LASHPDAFDLQDGRPPVEEMARSQQTPLGALTPGVVAGVVGTAAMDLAQFVRYRRGGGDDRLLAWEFSAGLKDWEQAPAPAHVAKRVVEGVCQRQPPPERAALVNNLTHWGYGIAWGGLFGLVEGSLRAPRIRHGLILGATVWTTSCVLLPLVTPGLEVQRQGPGQRPRRPPGLRPRRCRAPSGLLAGRRAG